MKKWPELAHFFKKRKKIERSKTIWKMFGSKAGAGVFNKFNVAMLRVK